MTIQPWIRVRYYPRLDCRSVGFNGAMTSQPWIRRRMTLNPCSPCSFNGAMTSQPWIRRNVSPRIAESLTSFNGATTSQPWIQPAPRPLSARRSCFNGAMTSQPWIPELKIQYTTDVTNLQWSHDLSAMDTTGTEAAIGATQLLQWSHDLSAMDMRTVPTLCAPRWNNFNGAMTMQLCIKRRAGNRQNCRRRASMEP